MEQLPQMPIHHNIDINNQTEQVRAVRLNGQLQQPVLGGAANNRNPPHVAQQILQQLSSDSENSSDETSSSDDDGALNQLGSHHVQFLNTMPAEGINLNAMQFQNRCAIDSGKC